VLSGILKESLMTFFHMMGQKSKRAVNIEKFKSLMVEFIAFFFFFSWYEVQRIQIKCPAIL
jgi:hypothetical protein